MAEGQEPGGSADLTADLAAIAAGEEKGIIRRNQAQRTRMNDSRNEVPALIAIGLLVSLLASLAHEAVGHGLGCLVQRGHITLLTFLVFRCAGAGVMTDGAGPLGLLVVSCLALALAWRWRTGNILARLVLLNLGAIGLFWVSGQAISEALDGTDDWGHVAAGLD